MEGNLDQDTLIFGGQARLPVELGPGKIFQLVAWMNLKNHKITDVSCSPCLPLVEKFIKEVLIRKNLDQDFKNILKSIEARYHHRSKQAVLTAVKEMQRDYMDYLQGKVTVPSGKLNTFSF